MAAEQARCWAKTKAGKPCRSRPIKGTGRCRTHALPDEQADDPSWGDNERALMRTLRALGPPSDEEAARRTMLQTLARAIDSAPTKAALWKEYREALSDLMKEASDDDRSLKEAIAALDSAAKVGDQAK